MTIHALGVVVSHHAIRFLGHDTHVHDEPHLLYAVSGAIEVILDDVETVVLRPREAVWLRPGVPHAVRVRDDGMVLGPTLDADVAPEQRWRMLGVVPALTDVMTTLLGAAPTTAAEIEPFRRALGTVLRRVGGQYFAVMLPVHPAVRVLARDAVRTPWTLAELSERHHLSVRQVQRVFLEETGLPFARWRARARMNAAAAHLLGGGGIAGAARLAGYTRAAFVRALSRESGIPAAELTRDPLAALTAAAGPA